MRAGAPGISAAVAEFVRWVLVESSLEGWGSHTGGDYRAVALLHLAVALSGERREAMLARAATFADDCQVQTAIAGAMGPRLRANAVRDSVTAIREAGRRDPGALVHLAALAGLCEEEEQISLLTTAANAGLTRPVMLGDVARAEKTRFWPHVATPIPPATAKLLWTLTRSWDSVPRRQLRARLAPCLPTGERAVAIDAVLAEIRASADLRNAEHDLVALTPHLDQPRLESVLPMVAQLGTFATEAVVLRCLELGVRIEEAFGLLDTLKGYWYWLAVVRALGLHQRPGLADALFDHLASLEGEPASLFIESHAESIAACLGSERLLPIIEPMAPAQRVLSLGSLAPYVAQREALLSEALATAQTLEASVANLHVFIASAEWLSESDARSVFAALLELHSWFGAALVGADGAPEQFPGIWQLVPLIHRLGGEPTLVAVAEVIASDETVPRESPRP